MRLTWSAFGVRILDVVVLEPEEVEEVEGPVLAFGFSTQIVDDGAWPTDRPDDGCMPAGAARRFPRRGM